MILCVRLNWCNNNMDMEKRFIRKFNNDKNEKFIDNFNLRKLINSFTSIHRGYF